MEERLKKEEGEALARVEARSKPLLWGIDLGMGNALAISGTLGLYFEGK